MRTSYRSSLLATTVLAFAGSSSALAQTSVDTQAAAAAVPSGVVTPTGSGTGSETAGGDIVVTGSRIARPNLVSSSPIVVVTGADTVAQADVTLDTYLNTLPQVNPAGTSTSNNPGNGGQSNINLRGLGSNRNLVLIDGRRPMVSASDLTVDLNTIPQGLISSIDVVTGGAGATYGADAISGVVNIKLKNNFEGLDLRGSYSNSIRKTDAREYQLSGTLGGNFAEGRGNLTISAEYSVRQGLIKAQRQFAAQATSTTGTPPVGRLVDNTTNAIPQAAINTVFGRYGVAAAQAPTAGLSQIHFNSDGTLFGGGVFNNPLDVSNFRYAVNSAAAPNQNFFPDFYSYNFDAINILVLPLKRKSAFVTGHYDVSDALKFYTQGGYTEYDSKTALAPTPIGTRVYGSTTHASQYADSTATICPTATSAAAAAANGIAGCAGTTLGYVTNSVIPVTNPFIPADLRTLLAARTGDDPNLRGSGANEPLRLAIRSLSTGLRETRTNNQVEQALAGFKGEILPKLSYDAYYSWGQTTIRQTLTGAINVQQLQTLLEAADGGASRCAGGYNPFGIQPISASCVAFISGPAVNTRTKFTQNIAQANLFYDLVDLPAGTVKLNAGVENRRFKYVFEPGALSGPIAGPNTQTPASGRNEFTDFYGEVYIPLLKDQTWAENLELTLGYRNSKATFNDILKGLSGGGQHSPAYKAELVWQPIREIRFRGSYQHSVRAPNFGELFSGGSSFVQAFDPCSITTNFRKTGGAAATALCQATGVSAAGVNSFVATPGLQVTTGLAGNTNLKPEKADTFTGGFSFNWMGFTGSVDYYNIRIKQSIFGPDTSLFIAACYGYQGGINTALAAANPYCQSIVRSGSNFSFVAVPTALGGDANSNFTLQNSGSTKTSGVDFQLGYRLPTDFLAPQASINFGLYVNYLIDFKVRELPGVTLDYAGTASYFGEGLGTSFPRWKGNLNIGLNLKPITFSSRIRYIDSMKNRASLQYPGETFTKPESVWYFDFAAQMSIDPITFRIGLNNAFNRKPPTYSPNVQSGTDPSLYDVVGRRAYVTAAVKF